MFVTCTADNHTKSIIIAPKHILEDGFYDKNIKLTSVVQYLNLSDKNK